MKPYHFLITLKGILFSFILLSFIVGCSKKDDDEDEAPTAPTVDFSFTPLSPKVNEAITFNNTSTNATSYQWSAAGTNFNSTEKNPTFTFTSTGTFDVKLVATGEGGSNTKTREISVAPADDTTPMPVAAFSFSPSSPNRGEEVSFTNESTNATSYQWSAAGTNFSSTSENPTFTFDATGDFDVKLVVTNSAGTDEISKTITVTAASGGGNNNPCNLPECYIETTTTVASGFTTTVTYTYTVVNGVKKIATISTATIAGTLITSIEYDATGKRIKDETKIGGVLQNYIEYEYTGGGSTVRANTYDAPNTFTGYNISQYDANDKLLRTDNYDVSGALQSYTVYSDFVNIAGSFPQLVETFDANNTLTQRDVHTYQNCQLIKTVSTDGSGTQIGEVNNTIDANGLLRTSIATIFAQGVTITSNSQYVYDCD